MSNKRQKVEQPPCIKIVEDALGLYLIKDIVGIVVDTFQPFYHSVTSVGNITMQVDFPCTSDCMETNRITMAYQKKKSCCIGPIPLARCGCELVADDDGELVFQRSIYFGNVPYAGVEMKQNKHSTQIQLHQTRESIDDGPEIRKFFDVLMECLIDKVTKDRRFEFFTSEPSEI
jgi:hypothetical protein